MKRKLLMALLAGTLAIAAPVSCFAAETTEVAEADAAEDSSDEEEDADAEEADAESADSDDTKEEKQVDDDGFVFVDHSKILEEEQIRKKLEKSRQDRERDEYQNLKGKGLGDLLSEEGKELDVKAWV